MGAGCGGNTSSPGIDAKVVVTLRRPEYASQREFALLPRTPAIAGGAVVQRSILTD